MKPYAKAAAESAEPVADILTEGLQSAAKAISTNAEPLTVEISEKYVKPAAKVRRPPRWFAGADSQ